MQGFSLFGIIIPAVFVAILTVIPAFLILSINQSEKTNSRLSVFFLLTSFVFFLFYGLIKYGFSEFAFNWLYVLYVTLLWTGISVIFVVVKFFATINNKKKEMS